MTTKFRPSALELSPSPATERRMRVLFAAAAVAIVVMMVVNVVAIRLIANDNRELHDEATPSLLAAKGLTLAAADMNGAQNRYVLDFGVQQRRVHPQPRWADRRDHRRHPERARLPVSCA